MPSGLEKIGRMASELGKIGRMPSQTTSESETSLLFMFRNKGTIKGLSNEQFSSENAAEALRGAFRGLGTDEKVIIEMLGIHSNSQRQEIKNTYKNLFGRNLEEDVEDELGGHFLDTCIALLQPPNLFDAQSIHKSINVPGSDETCLIEIFCSRDSLDIDAIKDAYYDEFERFLEDDIISDVNLTFRKLLRSLVTAGRDNSQEVDLKIADADCRRLVDGGIGKLGADDSTLNQLVCLRSAAQLKATFELFKKKTGQDIEQAIRKEFGAELKESVISLIKIIRNPILFFVERLHDSIRGPLTNDETLIRIIVSRSEIDLQLIKDEFQRKYKKTLLKAVRDDCSGDYCRMLTKIIGD